MCAAATVIAHMPQPSFPQENYVHIAVVTFYRFVFKVNYKRNGRDHTHTDMINMNLPLAYDILNRREVIFDEQQLVVSEHIYILITYQ